MVKQVLVEENISEYINSFKSNKVCTGGIIIGTKSKDSKQIIIKLAKSPEKIGKPWSNLKSVDSSWIASHAFQTVSYLPGGIEIIGLFLSAHDNEQKETQATLKQSLNIFYKLTKTNHLKSSGESMELLSVHIGSVTGSILSCKQFNIGDYKDTGSHVDWRYQSKIPGLNNLRTFFDIQFSVNLKPPVDNKPLDFTTQIVSHIEEHLTKLDDIFLEVDGEIRGYDEVFDKSSDGNKKTGKGKKQQTKALSSKSLTCNILMSSGTSCQKLDDCKVNVSNHVFTCKGRIMAMCYMAANATVKEAISHISVDIRRSLNQRLELILDEEIEVGKQKIALPKRVLTSSNVQFSEYLLEGETLEEGQERVKDTLDLTATLEESGETGIKVKFSDVEELPVNPKMAEVIKHLDAQENAAEANSSASNSSRMTGLVGVCSTAVICLMAWMMSNLEL